MNAIADDDSPLEVVPVGEAAWPRWQRLVFRYLLCHWLLYSLPRPLTVLLADVATGLRALAEWVGFDAAARPWRWPGKWAGELGDVEAWWQAATTWLSKLGLAPYEVIHQRTGSGDTAHDFARLLLVVMGALVATTIWSACDRSRAYPRLGRVLHLVVRWDLAFHLLGYGLIKLYGSQFGELGPMRLTTEVGDLMPMTLVGTFMQANPAYEVLGGLGETLAALLLFHRRTAALGAFLGVIVMAHVCALNWLCGVPVKLYSAHLLAFAACLLAPYGSRLCALFVSNRASAPVSIAVTHNPWLGWPLAVFGWLFAVGHLTNMHFQMMAPKPWLVGWESSPLQGVWEVESMTVDGEELPANDPARWRHLAIERGTLAWTRDPLGKQQFLEFRLAEDRQSATVRARGGPSGADAPAPDVWQLRQGKKVVSVQNPTPLRMVDRNATSEAERATLEITGTWSGRKLEVRTVEKVHRLRTPFRLRQELPDGW
jgi:hypothetical protein